MKKTCALLLGLLYAAAPGAAEISLEIELPEIRIADYRRPYVAAWIERPDHSVAANLLVWYDMTLRDNEGLKWLKDMRLWWRRTGRDLVMPVDSVSAATRAPGNHRLVFPLGVAPLAALPDGQYRLVVEASREHGDREVLTLPFQWPPPGPQRLAAEGRHELGRLVLELKP